MTPKEIWELVGAFLAGSGITELIRWLLGRKTRAVQDTVRLGEGWEGLVQELRADREDLREDLQTLSAWRDEAVKDLISLRHQVVLLQAEIQALKLRTEHLEQENRELREQNAVLQQDQSDA